MTNDINKRALISGVWYTVSNFIIKALVFITTPLFTRLLSQDDFGLYNNFISWLTTLHGFVVLNLESSFISARYEFEHDFDGYVSSMVGLSTFSSVIWLLLINIFSETVESITKLSRIHLNILVVYFMFVAVVNDFQAKERFYLKYKTSVFISVFISIGATVLSVLLVIFMDNDKLTGRVIGYTITPIVIGFFLFFYLMNKGRKVNIKYWKYALPICLPYIPHLLSLSILNSVDKIMITKMCGPTDTALYSLAYSCGAIVSVLVVSINTAFAPWLARKINDNKLSEINKVSTIYVAVFGFIACGIMLIAPEIIRFMGGRRYDASLYVMPPVSFGFFCQFVYTMYVNIEQFMKKTAGMAIASIISAIINYLLNLWLIPILGYIVAAYTTLFGFFCLMCMHMYFVYRMGYIKVYNTRNIMLIVLIICIFTLLVNLLYLRPAIRCCSIILYGIAFIILLYRGFLNNVQTCNSREKVDK